MVVSMRERYDVFSKLVNCRDVVWNKHLRFVIALDATWKEFSKELRIEKCYFNAYEDLSVELCQLFVKLVDSDSGTLEEPESECKDVNSEKEPEAAMFETSKPKVKVDGDLFPCGYLSDSPTSSSFFWNFMDEFYGSDSDADSVLPLPGIPSFGKKKTIVNCESSPSAKSKGPASSTTSNETPLKKIVGQK